MVSFKAVVYRHQQRQDGTYNVKVRIIQHGVSRHIPTTIFVTPQQLTRSLKVKDAAVTAQCERLLADLRQSIGKLSPFALDEMDADGVVAFLKRDARQQRTRIDFFKFGDEVVAGKSAGTGRIYRTAMNALERYLGKRELDCNDITARMLRDFAAWIDAEAKQTGGRETAGGKYSKGRKNAPKRGAGARYVYQLGHIYELARRKYNDEDTGEVLLPRHPFHAVDIPKARSMGQKALAKETVQALIDTPLDNPHRRAVDCALLSFCLMGINIADLYEAAPPVNRVFTYYRAKTRDRRDDRAEMRIEVPSCAAPIIARLSPFHRDGRWLAFDAWYNRRATFNGYVNRHLAAWCDGQGIPVFTTYALRHTWATLARSKECGVEKATVDECLAHTGDYRQADIYAEKDWRLLWDANAKVLALFSWEGQ